MNNAQSMSDDAIRVTLDHVAYDTKPAGPEIGRITNRLKRAQPSKVTPAELCEHVKHGKTFMCGTFAPNPRGKGWGPFLGQRLFGVDVDNKTGKLYLKPGEAGYLDPVDALDVCQQRGWYPLFLYFTMSADAAAGAVKYRIILDAGRTLTDAGECAEAMRRILAAFPYADKACTNPHTRLWLGGSGEVWPCYQFGRECWTGASNER